jgi:hypothetical protein
MRRKKNQALGYLDQRLGGIWDNIPRNRDELLSAALRFVKREGARYLTHRAERSEEELATLWANMSIEERIRAIQDAKGCRGLAALIDSTTVEVPDEWTGPQSQGPQRQQQPIEEGFNDDDRR